MATKSMHRAALAAGAMAAALVLVAGAGISPLATRAQDASVEPARIRTTPASVAARGRYPREERFVRDLYTRLMRYDFAAREFHAIESGLPIAPGSALIIALRDIRTQAWMGQLSPGASARGTDILAIQRQALCNGDDPCHAYYDVLWSQATAAQSAHVPTSLGDVSRYTSYKVTLTFGAVSRTYAAIVLYHDESDGTAMPEVFDPVIPDLDRVAGDRSPLGKAPWATYVQTRRYAAVTQKARAWHAEPRARALNLPIGYVIGDDVSAQEEATVVMAAESCAPACGDERDQLIAEYRNFGVALQPTCDSFVNSLPSLSYYALGSPRATNTWSVDDDYHWAILKTVILTNIECLTNYYGSHPQLNSGYRNPARNAAIPGSATNSRHLYGDAADLATPTSPDNQMYDDLSALAHSYICYSVGCVEPRNFSLNHFHVDYRGTCPTGW